MNVKKIYFIDRYDIVKSSNIKENSGYEQIVKYSDNFIRIKGNLFLSKILSKIFQAKIPKDYIKYNISKEFVVFFLVLLTGKSVFYLYADKDAFLLPLLKRKFNLNRIKLYGTLHWPIEVSHDFSFYSYNLITDFDGIITLSKKLSLNNLSKNSAVIHHGINLNYWKNYNPINYDNTYIILGESNRNHVGQVEIIRKIKELDPKAKFILFSNNKEVYQKYKNISDLNIIKERISDSELKRVYGNAKAVILIQNFCFASNTVLESIAMNVPLIVNRIGGIEEYLGENYPLYIDHFDNIQKFVFSTEYRLEVANYLEDISHNFDWDHIIQQTLIFLNEDRLLPENT